MTVQTPETLNTRVGYTPSTPVDGERIGAEAQHETRGTPHGGARNPLGNYAAWTYSLDTDRVEWVESEGSSLGGGTA